VILCRRRSGVLAGNLYEIQILPLLNVAQQKNPGMKKPALI